MIKKNALLKNKIIWILEDDFSEQFIYRKVLDIRYKLVFFKNLQEFSKAKFNSQNIPDLLIADLRLPDGNFIDHLTEKNISVLTKTIIVSCINDLDVLRFCFNCGITDYLTKPFDRNELIIKIENSLRNDDHLIESSDLVLKENLSQLTYTQLQIFSCLYKSLGIPLSRTTIIENVWRKTTVGEKTFDVHLVNLRKKLQKSSMHIEYRRPDSYVLIPK